MSLLIANQILYSSYIVLLLGFDVGLSGPGSRYERAAQRSFLGWAALFGVRAEPGVPPTVAAGANFSCGRAVL